MFKSLLILAIQMLPCIMLILLGWGFDELRTFVLTPARVVLMAMLLVGAFSAALLKLDFNPLRRGSEPVDRQAVQMTVLLLLSLFLLWFLPYADNRHHLTFENSGLRYVGLVLCGIGGTVRLLALQSLGEHFSAYVTLQPNHRLIRLGIYATIRHPLYLSLLLAPAGFALVFASYLALPIELLATIFVADRIRKEEHLLAAHFGTEFEEYRGQTRKLIPHVL